MFKRKPRIKIVVLETCGRKTYRAEDEKSYPQGYSWTYKNYLKQIDNVDAPPDYEFLEPGDGFKYVGKRACNNSACSIRYSNQLRILIGEPSWKESPGYDLSVLVGNDIWARATNTLYRKKPIPWIAIIIVIAILIASVIGYQMLKPKTNTGTTTTTEQGK